MSKDVLTSVGSVFGAPIAGISQAVQGPQVPDIPEAAIPPAPPPLSEETATAMPDPGDVMKKKKRQQATLKGITGGLSSTILSDAVQKIGG